MIRKFKLNFKNPKPYMFEEMKLSNKLAMTRTNELFYRYGPGNYGSFEQYDDFLIFFSDTMLNKLNCNNVWAVDGTFQVVPAPYYQLYSICYIKENHVFPAVFGILKNKQKDTYVKFFNILKLLVNINHPLIIKSDFESASISALRESFPMSRISGCQFHLGQSLYRKIQKVGLQSLYAVDNKVKLFTKCLMALSYVQIGRVRETFLELKNHEDFPQALKVIYDFFYDNYIGDNFSRFPIEL